MPDFELDVSKYVRNDQEKTNEVSNDVWTREIQMLSRGITTGAQQRAEDALTNWEVTSAELGGAMVAGYLMNAAIRRGGASAQFAKSLGIGLAIGDVTGRGIRTAEAIIDTAQDSSNFDRSVQLVAKSAGSAVFDYSLLGLGAYTGAKINGLTKMTLPEIRVDVSPRNVIDVPRVTPPFEAPSIPNWTGNISARPSLMSTLGYPLAVGAAVSLPRTILAPEIKNIGK